MIKALLTMDDFSVRCTPAIVDYLEGKHIPVILFAWGQNVEQYHDEALYAVKKGIVIGNHSYTHPHFSEISFDEGVKEIEKCESVLDELYKEAEVQRKYRPFRFPYGDKGGENKELLQKYLAEHGYDKVDDTNIPYLWWKENGLDKDIDTFWTFDFAEYNIRQGSGFTLDDVFKKMNDMNPTSGAALFAPDSYHILLFHSHDETQELVPEYYKKVLDECIAKGVVFVEPKFK
ncbi:polysaccharide deacetylase family protein [Butyrivibrio sp. VCB2006]|uniref:polysaccharide deacetylase family protein n=1 Tax=Butyrivibrio sp. VCB2006 TaxID=1280679 RepID=UPI000420C242|nr:polysaccharide deacetylase family protein [Butyrivibrio sp. VCB2006]